MIAIFPKTPAQLEVNFQTVRAEVADRLKKIALISEREFENTVLAFDKAAAYFRTHGGVLATLKMVHPDPEMRQKAEELLDQWSRMQIDLFEANPEIYRAFKECPPPVSQERKYYYTNALLAFQRAGLDLEPQKSQKFNELQKKIAILSHQFHSNISEDNSILCLENGEVLKCDTPTYFQVMTNCAEESVRRRYYHLFTNRAYPQNLKVLTELINCRDELAALLGYPSYAAYDIAPEMARTVERVEQFLTRKSIAAHEKIKSFWGDAKLKPWNVAFEAKKRLQVNQEEIAAYFPVERTLRNLLNVYEQFFSLKFDMQNSDQFWHPTVQKIDVLAGSTLIGYLLLDLFPRKNKYPHCCCNCIIPPGQEEPALAVVIANFSQSLLKHSEVKTFFHEFGHAIHALVGRAEMPTKAAYNTKTDFIEAPSQLLEEWMWDPQILKLISSHYQTGERLSDRLIEGLLQTRGLKDAAHSATGGDSDHAATELYFAQLSLKLFKEGKDKDLAQIEKEVHDSTPQIVEWDPEAHPLCTFGHLTSYGAKYYSYPWSKDIATNMFNYIKGNGGLLDPVMGQRYIDKVIGLGGSCDPNLIEIN